jgi:glutaredoxin
VKGFLSQKNLAFEVRDITADESAEHEIIDMGFTAVPVTVIGDSPPILGADFKKIEKALAGS